MRSLFCAGNGGDVFGTGNIRADAGTSAPAAEKRGPRARTAAPAGRAAGREPLP
ncbi:hypothetical protein DESPIGER_1715 [Desulfovibrio piger]|uniref:Uncharacterized protein n=1 Tax=Desulfovibrio piger TaxID=901 RepID=A0A1K1LFQ7_9BACT|nr:hypothetical protein DESPIGER_1715 [Desulfovibrio piger]